MIEMRTYLLKPGTVPQAEQAFADKIAERVKLSPLAGFWRTEVGTLNQIIHIWTYKDINERNEIRAKAVAMKVWPPAIADFVARRWRARSSIRRPSRRTSSRASTAAATSSAPTPTAPA